jgi:hypothetical protein
MPLSQVEHADLPPPCRAVHANCAGFVLHLQLEKVRLDAETTLKRLEAEGALARAAAAQAEAAYKADRAAWVTSLDAQKFEVQCLGRNCFFRCCLAAVLHAVASGMNPMRGSYPPDVDRIMLCCCHVPLLFQVSWLQREVEGLSCCFPACCRSRACNVSCAAAKHLHVD